MRHILSFLLLTFGLLAAESPVIKVAVYDDVGATGKGIPCVEVIAGKTSDIKLTKLKGADIAAGALLIRESGGLVTNFKGSDDVLDGGDIMTANPKLLKQIAASIR